MTSRYAFGKTVDATYEQALERVTQALATEGFGVLTEIDVQATLKKKLDLDRPRQKILGACNPSFAAKALDAEPAIGLLLPCNVVVREDEAGRVQVEFLDPGLMAQLTDSPAISDIATEVGARLRRVYSAL